jgi:hypothetical protein
MLLFDPPKKASHGSPVVLPNPQKLRVRVTQASGKEYESRTTPILTKAFHNDAPMTYYLNRLPKSSRTKALGNLIHLMSTAAMVDGGIFYESGTLEDGEEDKDGAEPRFHCAAVFVPPGKKIDDLGLKGWWALLRQGVLRLIWDAGVQGLLKLLIEYPGLAEREKKKVLLKNEQYYYLLIIGTAVEHRGKGLCPAIIREHQVVAQEKKIPIWLEASSTKSRAVYAKAGFEDVGEPFVMGKGKCDADGEKAKGTLAVGLTMYPMVWWPKGYVRGNYLEGKIID